MTPHDLRRGMTFTHRDDDFVILRVLGGTVLARNQRTGHTRHLATDVVSRAVAARAHRTDSSGDVGRYDLSRVCAGMGMSEVPVPPGMGDKCGAESVFRAIDDLIRDLPGHRPAA